MNKLFFLLSLFSVSCVSASWEPRKRIRLGLDPVAYEVHKQQVNARNFGRVYTQVNDERIKKSLDREQAKPASENRQEEA